MPTGNKKVKVPKQLLKNMGLTTTRQYKARKRKELKAVEKAMEKFRSGSVCCPGYGGDYIAINDGLRRLTEKLSAKNWGR